jgi:hypothetical protein
VVLGGLAAWAVLYPTTKTARLEFRLDFEGIQEGEYPNGTKFSVEDLLSEPVLRRVWVENDLQRYGKFEKFRSTLFVTSSNRALEMLEAEYRSRLADTKLPPVDRQRIEREFREKAAALRTSTFALTISRQERLREMDRALLEKVLRSVLGAWAEDAAKTRGALKYDIPTYSKAILQKELLDSEDYLIAVDMLRTKVNRVIKSVDDLLEVPGIQVIRLPETGVSLPEVRVRLEDLNNFRIAPAVGLIRSTGLSKSPASTLLYVENRLFEVNLEQTLAADRERKMKESFEVYLGTERRPAQKSGPGAETLPGMGREAGTTAVIPQFGETFIDRIMELANRNSDVTFRQDLTERMIKAGLEQVSAAKEAAYYRELQAAFRGGMRSSGDSAARTAAAQEVERRFTTAATELEKNLDDIQALYGLVSERNLRPASALFSTESPMKLVSTSAFSVTRFAALAVLFVVFVTCAVAAWALFRVRVLGARGV